MTRHILAVAVMAAVCLGQSDLASGEAQPGTATPPAETAGPVGPRLLWQIGESDNDFQDLVPPAGYVARTMPFPAEVILRPGTDSPAGVWPAVHPALMDDWAGSKLHPFTVLFDLPEKPRGTFVLKMDLLGIHAWYPPIIEVELNGQRGSIVLPKTQTDYGVLNDSARGREYVVEVEIAGGVFVRGTNRLVITVDKGGWIMYDALSLANDPADTTVRSLKQVALKPTLRFVRQGDSLKQVMELTARFSPGVAEAGATIRAGDRSTRWTLHPDIFGFVRQEVYVEEVTQVVDAVVTVELDGRTASARCKLSPERRWKVFIQGSVHADIGFTDLQENVKAVHNQITARALEACQAYPEFKWNTEIAWVVDNFIHQMPPPQVELFRQLGSQGRIGTQAFYGHMLTGVLSHEAMIRAMYFAESISRTHGLACDYALSCDVPTFAGTLPTILAGSGIRYFSAGLNQHRASSFNRLFDKSPFYWQGPDGSRVLTYWGENYGFAGSLLLASNERTAVELEDCIRPFERPDYPCDAILIFGAFGDNLPNPPLSDLARGGQDWNGQYAYPQIIFCRGPEFFEYLEATCKDKIPTLKGSGGFYWEDGVGSSATETGLNRLAKEELATAEKLHALVAAGGGAAYPATDLEEAWKNAVLFDEHTWGAHCSISQPHAKLTLDQWRDKARFAHEAKRLSGDLIDRGLADLAKQVNGKQPSVVVFNPHGWPVSGWVQAQGGDGAPFGLWAEEVPALGWRTYPQPPPAASPEPPPAASLQPAVTCVENGYYRLQWDPATGAVRSLFDKELEQELVDAQSPYGLNQYLYVAGYGESLVDATRQAPTPPVAATVERRPYGQAVILKGSGHRTPQWTSEIVLHDRVKRIDFNTMLHKEETTDKEAGYFVFPFLIRGAEFLLSQPNGALRPAQDILDGGCMQWYCAQDYVAVVGDEASIVWTAVDSPLVTLSDINRETFQSPIPITNSHVYAYVFNNYWDCNYRALQGGLMQFRFSLTSARTYDPLAATRFGQSVRNPLRAALCPGGAAEEEESKRSASMLSVAPPHVVVQAVKRAQCGDGFIVRLREVGGLSVRAEVTFHVGAVGQAWSCDLLERKQRQLNLSQGRVEVDVAANGLSTLWVQ